MVAYLEPTTNVSAAITHRGRELIAKSLLGSLSFRLLGFKVGQDGYDHTTPKPTSAVPVNPAATDLILPIFPLTGYAEFITIETPFPNVVAPVCRLHSTEANFGLGEIGIWSEVLNSTDPAYTTGEVVLFALGHFPLLCKNENQNVVFRVLIAT